MAVFSVKTGKASEEETRQARLSQEDLTWWSENSPKLVVEENRGKYIAVVNKEAIFGDSYQEAQKKAMAKYPDQRFLGFFKTARFGVEDTLTLFSRQTPPIGGKSAEKSCDSVAFATADTCGLNPPSRWFPSQSPTAQRGSDPVVCHGQRVRYCVLSPTTTGIPDSLVF